MKKRTARILTGVAVIVVALAVLYGVAVAISAHKLRQVYAALQKAGRPMDVKSIVPPMVRDSENAALLYESAALLLRAQPSASERGMLRHLLDLSARYVRGTGDPNRTAELEQQLRSDVVTLALAMVEQGAERPSCRFDLDYEAGISMRMPPLGDLRDFCWMLRAKARLDSHAGRPDDAWRAVHTQLRLANALRADPLLISQLVRLSMVNNACDTIQKLCQVCPPTTRQIQDVEQLIRGFDSIDPLILAVDGERLIYGEPIFRLPHRELREASTSNHESDPLFEFFDRLHFRLVTFKPLFLADHAAYLQLAMKNVTLLQDPNVLDKADAFEREFDTMQKHHFITATRSPALARIAILHYQMVANVRITLTGMTLLQYKQTNGSFPESLDALGMQGIEDPFSRKPLVYRREAGGFLLYSVGQDRKDNGGTPKPKKGRAEYDILWRFPAPAQAMISSNQ